MTSSKRLLWIVLVLLLGCECAKHVVMGKSGPRSLGQDSQWYWRLGEQMAGGDVFLTQDADAFRPPAYPAFLATIRAISGEHARWAVMIVQQLLIVATAGLVAWLVWKITNSRFATILSLALSLFCVSRAFFATQVWSEDFFAPLLAAHVALAVAWHKKPAYWLAFAMGLTVGVCALTRPVAQYLIVPVALAMLVRHRETGRRMVNLRHAMLAILVLVVTLSPWYSRNYVVFDEAFLTKGKGRSLWLSAFRVNCGNLPFPDTEEFKLVDSAVDAAIKANPLRQPQLTTRRTWDVYHCLRRAGMTELEAEGVMVSVAKSAIRDNPYRFARSVVARWFRYWAVTFVQDRNQERYKTQPESLVGWAQFMYRHFSIHWLWVVNAAFAILAAFGAISLVWRSETRSIGIAIALVLLYFASISAVGAQPMYRLRLVVEPVMIICAACAVVPILAKVRKSS